MSKTVTLTYKGNSVVRELGSKAETNPVFYKNRLHAVKTGYASAIVTERWLQEGKITVNNLRHNENGEPLQSVAYASMSDALVKEYEAEIAAVAGEISIE